MERPPLAPGHEWVWDYPRPPRLERSSLEILVVFDGVEIARSSRAWRILETSHPPVYYIPREDVRMEFLRPASGSSFCEWKGTAAYFDVHAPARESRRAAWTYPKPASPFGEIAHAIAFYPGRVDACFVGGERVQAQAGDFYGGWITANIVGPFKGAPGTAGW
jgi:uncharacterized protein (DUF427 family)